MSSSISKSIPSNFCPVLQQHARTSAERPELLFVYGGMRPDEIEWLLVHRHLSSRIFWLVPNALALSDALVRAQEAGRLAVATLEDDPQTIFFDFFEPKQALTYVLLDAQRASPEHTERCEAFLLDVRKEIRNDVFLAGTLVTKGPLWQNNTLQNLSLLVRSPGLDVLHNLFVGRTAVVVGAGPSLTRAIPLLKSVQDRLVVISTGTALAPLRAAGIRPDLVVAVDGSPLIAQQFNCPCDDLYLASSSVVYPGITRPFKGNFFGLLDVSPLDQWVKSEVGIDGTLYPGGTVTACGISLASEMGCQTVLVLGLDLAFEGDGPSHASGTMYDQNPLREPLISVPGNYADSVQTTRQFACYIDLVETLVGDVPETRVINVNDRGARIEGMELADFSILSEWEREAPWDALAAIEAQHRKVDPDAAPRVRGELAQVAEFLQVVQTRCREGAMAANRFHIMQRQPRLADPEEMRQCLAQIQRVDEFLDEGRAQCEFLQMSLWPIAYELSEIAAQNEERFDGNRMRHFYEQVAGAAKWTRQLIVQACAEMECRADQKKCEKISTTGETDGRN